MSVRVQHRRDSTANVEANTPAAAELWFDTSKKETTLGDGVTAGGVRLAKKNIADSLEPAQITADVNDYNPADQKHARTLLMTSDAFHDVTGLVPSTVTDDIDGREITLYNYGLENFRLVDQSPASVAANRFDLGGASLTLAPKTSATLRYDKASQRWFLIAQTVGSSVGSGSVIAMTLAASSQGYSIINGTIQTSVSGGALTVKIKTLAGNDPSALDPVLVKIRKGTLSDGGFTVFTLTAATSFVVSNGSSLGVAGASVPFRLWLVAFDDGGTFRLGIVNCLLGYAKELALLKADTLASAAAEGGAGAADSSGVFYTSTAVASKPFEVLGYLDYPAGLAAAGAWSIGPTTIQPFHAGIRLPGGISDLATGTADGFKYIRDDRTLAYPNRGVSLAPGTDLNNVQTPGLYEGNSFLNSPDGTTGWFYIEVSQPSFYAPLTNVFLHQKASSLDNQGQWVRSCISGTWGAWCRLDSRVFLAKYTGNGTSAFLQASNIFSTAYDEYEIVIDDVLGASGTQFLFQFETGGIGTFPSSNYSSNAVGGSGSVVNTNAGNGIPLVIQATPATSGRGVSGRWTIHGVNSTSTTKALMGVGYDKSNASINFSGGQYTGANGSVTGIRLWSQSSGSNVNIASGSMKIYGLR